jgi:lipid A 4'-phosphatase
VSDPAAAGRRARRNLAFAAALIGVGAAILFLSLPRIDIAVSRLFYEPGGGFLFDEAGWGQFVRQRLDNLFWLLAIAAILGTLAALARRRLGLGPRAWIFLVVLFVLGPGLIANALLKEHWDRARPRQIVELGGERRFTPPLVISDQCARNCSFVAGEASSAFAAGFGLALLVRRRRALAMAGAVAVGGLAGFIRIAQGGHFLSDVVFAGVFMALAACLTHWLVFDAAPKAWRRARQ